MKSRSIQSGIRFAVVAIAIGLLSACDKRVDVADGGIRGTGSSIGPVSGFGSVIVNGTTFDTDQITNAEVESNDGIECERGCTNSLQKGMIVRVTGQWLADGTGIAESLEYDDTFRGVVTDVSVTRTSAGGPSAGTFKIQGQEITFDRKTVIRLEAGFESAADLEGKLVRVSAWRNGNSYRSSFVGETDDLSDVEVELEGQVTHFSEGTRRFSIGSQVIEYRDANVFKGNLDQSDLNAGKTRVEVEGGKTSNIIVANTIRRADDRRFIVGEGEDIEIAGPVENFSDTATEFLVNGVSVTLTDETDFSDIASNRIENGLLVRVEGEFVNGRLIAEELELLESDAEVVAKYNGDGRLNGSWVVGGVTVLVSRYTLIDADDDHDGLVRNQSFLEVEGVERKTDDGFIYIDARSIEIENEGDNEFELRGRLRPDSFPTDSTDIPDSFTILGLRMDIPDGVIEDQDDYADVLDCQYLAVEYGPSGLDQFSAETIECDD